ANARMPALECGRMPRQRLVVAARRVDDMPVQGGLMENNSYADRRGLVPAPPCGLCAGAGSRHHAYDEVVRRSRKGHPIVVAGLVAAGSLCDDGPAEARRGTARPGPRGAERDLLGVARVGAPVQRQVPAAVAEDEPGADGEFGRERAALVTVLMNRHRAGGLG